MALKKAGEAVEYEKRESVYEKDLIGKKFLIERVGKGYEGKFGLSFPIDVTVEGLGERVYWTSGSVIRTQIMETPEDELVGTTVTVVERESKNGRTYRALEETV